MELQEIRIATIGDARAVAVLFHDYRRFYGIESNPADCERFIAERLNEKDSTIFLAVGREDAAMGFVQLFPLFSEVTLQRIWLLNDLYVLPSARRMGVAEGLMDRARVFVQSCGGSEITLSTAPSNAAAQGLYEKLGYIRNDEFWVYRLPL